MEQEIIDVLIAFDAETIISKFGTNTNATAPVQITDNSLIFMITKQADVVSGNAGNELNIKAQTLDVIRWRETSLNMDATYTGILYKFEAPVGGNLVSTPTPLEIDVNVPLPDPSNPTVPKTQAIKDYFWQCTVQEAGNVTYHFSFMVVDRHGIVQGYFWWDPFITIAA
ncbi:MAG TPA: inclusion body family protein [Haliscomenobacter sp.]|uniref:inclusion body family protein n=1 Tax=Haliscomenobacter sp. TaxID=2717303 RepID=UPI002C167987|nr:inclusion body family protein [Haliscomenobacter sp.]HOY18419.1 inclusion body family protein [Haliscomenobacter sp.]